MSRRPTARLAGYAAILALGAYAAVALDRVALLALVVPFALWLSVGLASATPPDLDLTCRLDQERIGEDGMAKLVALVSCRGPVSWVEAELELPDGLVSDVPGNRQRLRPQDGVISKCGWELRPQRWGTYRCGPIRVRAQDRFGLMTYSVGLGQPLRLRVFPAFERLRELVAPARTQLYAGNRIARRHGEGIEFASIRDFTAGDRVRRVNWRATARSGIPLVNDFHLERNADVILFVDSFVDLGVDQDSVLTLAVRAAAALAEGYLGERDRVGVVGFGGLLRWLLPGMGPRHFYRVVEALLDTQVVTSYAWRAIDVIPRRVLPPAATIVALTPFLDPRSLGALADLHHRGFELVVIEISPERFLLRGGKSLDPLALRLWQLVRAARRRTLQRAGVIVVEWPEGTSLEAVLGQVREYRRFARRSAA